ncbi:uncharacterized protein LOC105438408 [Strongylocentrotus purpuratus]|uniref:B box-type domain-containing protein n=1 Tax=Strongylocentrotus purpuratus TaxID=7668 RepID=A0A7M7HGD1_STRPU|nr:uncharacterized protein LOC105438408 [Strongylocentrotus purpuratus]|eukprot:XP_011664484.1 PREDICTED: uncharacterized protein LOC105438408 [Strongylocentrotus purpuratus]
MASKFPGEKDEKVELRTRKGHDMTWSCDIHGESIKFYCKEHEIPLCHPCATKDHQKPCHLENIEDVILERRRKLDVKQPEIEEMKKQQKALDYKLESIAASASNHLQSVNDDLQTAFENKLKSVKEKEERAIRSINEEADEEIQIINEKREGRIKSCHEEAEQQQLILKESQAKVESDTKTISEVIPKKIKYLKNKNQHAISTLDKIDSKIKRITQEDKTLVNETPQVLESLDEHLSLNVHQDVSDCLERIQSEVLRVKFVEGEVGGEHYGRIDGYISKWELVKSIRIPPIVDYPRMCGLISDNEICVREARSNHTYVTNISNGRTQKVIEGDGNVCITSCAPIDSNVIVCGKWRRGFTGDSLDGCITLYDRQWKVIRDISIPTNSCYYNVYVDVDRDGMILAGQRDQSNIYVINPADGKIVNTITMQGKVMMGGIQALSSGDIVVKTCDKAFPVISRSGEEKAVIHSDEWCKSWCRVDKLTDTVYTTYVDTERNICAVDQVSCDGIIEAKRIVEYEDSCHLLYYINSCLATHSGNLVACDGDNFFVFEKSFIV